MKAGVMSRYPHALCVDMESAVLMEGWHPLIIRGISDYADSHYNWNWVIYASAAAAAVAKSVIEMLYIRDQQMFLRRRGSDDRPPAGEHKQIRVYHYHMDLRRYSDTTKAGTSHANATRVSLQQNWNDEIVEADEPMRGQPGTQMTSFQSAHELSDLSRGPLSDDQVPPPPAPPTEAVVPATSNSFQEILPQHRPVDDPKTFPDPNAHRGNSAPPEVSTTTTVPDSQSAVSKPPPDELFRLSQAEYRVLDATNLVGKGVDVKAKDKHGNTPLHYSVKRNDTSLTRKLLDVEPSLASERNLDGETPLHLCAQLLTRESFAHAKLLLSLGVHCNPNIIDATDQTALDYTIGKHPTEFRKEMLKLLLAVGATWPSSGSRYTEYTDVHSKHVQPHGQTET